MSDDLAHTENDLLIKVSNGSEIAFRELFNQYRNKIYSLGMYLTKSEVLSEEIIQDVFLKVWEKREQLATINYFNAWLRTIARNICSNYLRNLAIEKIAIARLSGQDNMDTTSPENNLVAKEYEQLIDAAIRQLPPQQKKVYTLSRQSGKKQEDIAKELNISIYTVKEYMKLAQRSVRTRIQQKLDLVILVAITICLR